MAEHWRLGTVERAVLAAMRYVNAVPGRPHRKCANIVGTAAQNDGISPRWGYAALCAMAQPWRRHLRLVDFHGNLGSADPDDEPAPPRFTEARLTPIGLAALEAEEGAPPVPAVLINGDLHLGGAAPPYAPVRVVAALLALLDDPELSDADLIDMVGPPVSPTGCTISCDERALGDGESVQMSQSASTRFEQRADGNVVVLTDFPLGIGPDTVVAGLTAKVAAMNRDDPDWEPYVRWPSIGAALEHDERYDREPQAIPLADIRNESHGDSAKVVCYPLPDAEPIDYLGLIVTTWGVSTRETVRLAAPLPVLLRELVSDDVDAQRNLLRRL